MTLTVSPRLRLTTTPAESEGSLITLAWAMTTWAVAMAGTRATLAGRSRKNTARITQITAAAAATAMRITRLGSGPVFPAGGGGVGQVPERASGITGGAAGPLREEGMEGGPEGAVVGTRSGATGCWLAEGGLGRVTPDGGRLAGGT